jgi:hypothetical protein
MTQAIQGVNARRYEPTSSSDVERQSSGGAPATSASGGAEGAGNIEKSSEKEARLSCLPEVVLAAKDCGAALLVRNFTNALSCALRLEALRECLMEEPTPPPSK